MVALGRKSFYQVLLLAGVCLAFVGGSRWAEAGFSFSFWETLSVLGGKHWHVQKDSHFFLMALGVLMVAYAVIGLQLKRWERK